MTKRMFVLGALLLTAFSTAALAADVTGKWKANFEGPMGSMEITTSRSAESSSPAPSQTRWAARTRFRRAR